MDEKSFGRGQSYITLLTDLEQSRSLRWWRSGRPRRPRSCGSADTEQKQAVSVAVDMWEPFIRTIEKEVPTPTLCMTSITSELSGQGGGQGASRGAQELLAEGDETLKGTRQLWLYNPENFNPEQRQEFADEGLALKVRGPGRQGTVQPVWNYRGEGWRGGFQGLVWLGEPEPTQAVVEVAQMLKRHLETC